MQEARGRPLRSLCSALFALKYIRATSQVSVQRVIPSPLCTPTALASLSLLPPSQISQLPALAHSHPMPRKLHGGHFHLSGPQPTPGHPSAGGKRGGNNRAGPARRKLAQSFGGEGNSLVA